jgi:ATP-binding cassette, subfamily C (CFTR/MRP), member 1
MLVVDGKTMDKFKNSKIFDPKYDINSDNSERLLALNQEIYRNFNQSRAQARLKPSIHIKGTMSLMEQAPWVLNATIRDNILFGEPLDEATYNRTIEICQLGRDLEILSGGDLTQIGEKGINLSGGQKARIGIARAVYSNKDILLMDDPLSALDAHVKKKVFDDVFCKELRDKTKILITHAIDFLDQVDKIIVMEKGKILHQGSFAELKHLEYFQTILDHMRKEDIGDEEEVKIAENKPHNDLQN